jgi:hypothetical protein
MPNNKTILNENLNYLIELIQNVIQYINTNRLNNSNLNIQNKQFTYTINNNSSNGSKVILTKLIKINFNFNF